MQCIDILEMITLPISNLIDFSKLTTTDNVEIEILNTTHRFSPDSSVSGTDVKHQPIFGSNVFINGALKVSNTFGLPTMLFPQGIAPSIHFNNSTKFTTNVHFHGFVNTGLVDGSSSFGIFGPSTSLGTNVNIQLPVIKNNSALLWYHAHNMFRDAQLAYAGIVGAIIVTDAMSKPFTDLFIYGDNHIVLNLLDIDLDENGCQIFGNLTAVDSNRSCFTAINGVSTIQWYMDASSPTVAYSNVLSHDTSQNIVKVDFVNATGNFRVFYLGVCDINKAILPFYVIQTDQGLCPPKQTTVQFVPVGGRISMLVDLTNASSAYIFAYDYDLTEKFDWVNETTGIFPDFGRSSSTPYPSPIPDPTHVNPQYWAQSTLQYPPISSIPQIHQTITNGRHVLPATSEIRPFLCITKTSSNNDISMQNALSALNNIVYKNGIPPTVVTDYIDSLNPNYYYNIPNVNANTPTRNLCIWGETTINYEKGDSGNTYIMDSTGKNVHGITEWNDGAMRIRVDLWNSAELDLNEALIAYSKSPNNYKPSVLPTSDFRITKTNDDYINIAMISNDTCTIQGFGGNVSYSDTTTTPIFSVTITLPPSDPRINLNIQQWINLLNNSLRATTISLNGQSFSASNILSFDWSFFPYAINLHNGTVKYFKSAVIKTKNLSNYCVRILGRWALLQMMGKNVATGYNATPPIPHSGPCCSLDAPCDEEYLYGVYDNLIQTTYPYYSTDDMETQTPILCPRRNAKLIIQSGKTHIGFFDEMANDNINVFSTKLRTTEIWTYLNADNIDSHPIHFHLTGGFSYKSLSAINSMPGNPGSEEELGLTHTYSRDIYQVGPQQSLSFALTWPYYSSQDTTSSPYIPNIGANIHCHFLPHYDQNSMALIYSVKPESNFISDVCFSAGTPVQTDQGVIPIETIQPGFHTIHSKKIVDITKTMSLDKHLVCFEKNSLAPNVPSHSTTMSKNHKLFYKRKMVPAEWFVGKNKHVHKVLYDGKVIYNVLMENYEKIIVNNLVCETLHPENQIAKLHMAFKNLDIDTCNAIIAKRNHYSITSAKRFKNTKMSLNSNMNVNSNMNMIVSINE